MRILTPYLAIAALVAPASLSAESFEGKVTMQMTGRGGTAQEVSYTMKGSRVLIGIGTMAGVIMDRDKNEITVLMPQQRMYMVRPMPQVPANPQAPNGAPNDVSFQETGVTEKILGYTCTKYLVKSKGSTTELWVTDQLGSFAGFGPGMGGGRPGGGRGSLPQPWEQALRGKNFFPMRVVGTGAGKGGAETFRLEVTAVDRQPVDDSALAPPADWQKLDVGAMMGGFAPH